MYCKCGDIITQEAVNSQIELGITDYQRCKGCLILIAETKRIKDLCKVFGHEGRKNGLDRRGNQRYYCKVCNRLYTEYSKYKPNYKSRPGDKRLLPRQKRVERVFIETDNKQAKYRRKCLIEGRCTHCGKPCAPYSTCEKRRESSRNRRKKKWINPN